jgi:ribosome-associated toxin RatA of RatAB toxin-antitoxin module
MANYIFLLVVIMLTIGQASDANRKYDWETLFNRQVVIEKVQNNDGIPGVKALFVVNASKEKIWNCLLNYKKFPEIFETANNFKILKNDKHGAQIEYWIDVKFKKYKYVIYREYADPFHLITWKKIKGDLERVEGSWEIIDTPHIEEKLIIFTSFVEVGGFVPTNLILWSSISKAKTMAIRLRTWLEKIDG